MSTDVQQENLDDNDQAYNDQDHEQDQDQDQDNYNDNDDNGEDQNNDGGDDDCGDDQNNDQDDDNVGPDGVVPKYIRLRGLPWSATHKEILNFLKFVNVINGSKGIHLITSRWDGKNTGEAYVEVKSQHDVEKAINLNKCSMGHRYIEVFTANAKEAREAMRKTNNHGSSSVVKLRGLPYAVTEQQVEEFFKGLEIKPDREGILFVMDRRGRATGEAFVQFETEDDTEQALGRNREKIGHRYIEIFRSSLAELKRAASGNGRPGPYDIKERGGNRVNDFGGGRNMRGGNGNDWGNNNNNNSNFGVGIGANNSLGFGNMSNFTNTGNFGNGFGNNNGNGFGNNNGGNFGNNNGGNFNNNGGGGGGNFGNNFGNNSNFGNGNSNNSFGGNNRFNNNSNNFSNDFGDFNNFGNNRNFNNNMNDFGNNRNNNSNFGNFGNLGNFGNNNNNNGGGGNNNMGGGGFNGNMGGGNFGPIGGGRNESDFYTIHMRGLPYSSYENDVFKFFEPVRPANVRINFNKKGLHSGTADALFDTYEDAQMAMKRHREQMGSRYIELFFDGKVKSGGNSVGGGGGGSGVSGGGCGNSIGNYSRRI